MKNLLLITLSYPYAIGGEVTFLKEEVKRYAGHFNKAVLLPGRVSEEREATGDFLELDHSLAEHTRKSIRFPRLLLRLFDKPGLLAAELISSLKKGKGLAGLKSAFADYLLTMSYWQFLENYFKKKQGEEWLIYTYWFTPITNAAAMFAKGNTHIRVISRAHGIDLYEYRNRNYIPFRERVIGLLHQLVLVSDFGKRYILDTYSSVGVGQLSTFGIGTPDSGITCAASPAGAISLVSCSSIDENKRLYLIVEGLAEFSRQHPEIKISWSHFGDGPLMEQVAALAAQKLNAVEYHFKGKVSNDGLMQFYRSHPVDMFLTTSASEGGRPVSIMEALGCGVPVMGTAVGGIPELVGAENGQLLSADATAAEIARGLGRFAQLLPAEREQARAAARKKWEQLCRADSNFSEFTSYLSTL